MSTSFKRISPQIWNSVFLIQLKRSSDRSIWKQAKNLLLSLLEAPSYKVVSYITLVSLLTLLHVIQIVLYRTRCRLV